MSAQPDDTELRTKLCEDLADILPLEVLAVLARFGTCFHILERDDWFPRAFAEYGGTFIGDAFSRTEDCSGRFSSLSNEACVDRLENYSSMLRILIHELMHALIFAVTGDTNGPWAQRRDLEWPTQYSSTNDAEAFAEAMTLLFMPTVYPRDADDACDNSELQKRCPNTVQDLFDFLDHRVTRLYELPNEMKSQRYFVVAALERELRDIESEGLSPDIESHVYAGLILQDRGYFDKARKLLDEMWQPHQGTPNSRSDLEDLINAADARVASMTQLPNVVASLK